MKWISVKDRLPEYNKKVFIITTRGHVTVGWLEDPDCSSWDPGREIEDAVWFEQIIGYDDDTVEVTHWAEIEYPEDMENK